MTMRHAIDPDQPRKRQFLFEELRLVHEQAAAIASLKEHGPSEQSALVVAFRKAADITAQLRALDKL